MGFELCTGHGAGEVLDQGCTGARVMADSKYAAVAGGPLERVYFWKPLWVQCKTAACYPQGGLCGGAQEGNVAGEVCAAAQVHVTRTQGYSCILQHRHPPLLEQAEQAVLQRGGVLSARWCWAAHQSDGCSWQAMAGRQREFYTRYSRADDGDAYRAFFAHRDYAGPQRGKCLRGVRKQSVFAGTGEGVFYAGAVLNGAGVDRQPVEGQGAAIVEL